MNYVKTFRTSVREMMNMDDIIAAWVNEENVTILSIATVHGENYSSFGSRVENKEIFLIVTYTKKSNKKTKTENKV